MDDNVLDIKKAGETVLKLRASQIPSITDNLLELVNKMVYTMYQAIGVGLAAPQIGESIQLAVIDVSMGEDPAELMVMINPKIIESSGKEIDVEGCLSVPGYSFPIARKEKLLIEAIDRNGKEFRKEFSGFHARVIQHELDHLNGVLILDHISTLKRQLINREINRKKKNGEW